MNHLLMDISLLKKSVTSSAILHRVLMLCLVVDMREEKEIVQKLTLHILRSLWEGVIAELDKMESLIFVQSSLLHLVHAFHFVYTRTRNAVRCPFRSCRSLNFRI